MTVADLIALGWTVWQYPNAVHPWRLDFQQHTFRFLLSGDLRVVEHYQHGRLTGRDYNDVGSYDAALAKLCARQHSSGVTLGEWLRGLALPAGGG
jgi:hypothetical protein